MIETPINAMIVDDEIAQRQVIKSLIKTKYSNINIVAEADKVEGTANIIETQKPDLLFLDVELKDGNSFDILKTLTSVNFKIIFITGYSKYAIDALKFSALDYILKPVNSNDFFNAVNKAISEIGIKNQLSRIENLIQNLQNTGNNEQKIVLKTQEDIHLVKISDIIRCESTNAYVTFHLVDKRKVMVTSSLGYYEELLSANGFFRIHQSHLINQKYIEVFQKKEGGYVVLSDKSVIPISQRKKTEFIDFLNKLGIQ